MIDRLKFFLDFTEGGAWSFLVRGVIRLVNSDNERDLILLIRWKGASVSHISSVLCIRANRFSINPTFGEDNILEVQHSQNRVRKCKAITDL